MPTTRWLRNNEKQKDSGARGSRAHHKKPSQTLPRTPKLWEPLESPAAQPVSPGWGFVVPCLLPSLSTKHVPALAALQPPGRLLASQPVASSNFPSCLRALPQPKGPGEMSSCLPLTGMGPVQVSLSIQSRVPSAPSCPRSPSSAKWEDLDQKPEKQETWQPAEENPHGSAAPRSDVPGVKPGGQQPPGPCCQLVSEPCTHTGTALDLMPGSTSSFGWPSTQCMAKQG